MAVSVFAETGYAPSYNYSPVEETYVWDNSISSLANTSGVDLNNPVVILNEVNKKYRLDYDRLYNLINCESGFNVKAFNPKDTDGLPAFGLLQFKEGTFYSFAKKYKVENPDIWDARQQLNVGLRMISEGYGYLWGCDIN